MGFKYQAFHILHTHFQGYIQQMQQGLGVKSYNTLEHFIYRVHNYSRKNCTLPYSPVKLNTNN